MFINKLKYPPIKISKQLPENLIYRKDCIEYNKYTYNFNMYNLKNKNIAHMKCYKDSIDRDGKYDVPSLYILYLRSRKTGQGLGSKFIKFAKFFSKQIGCNGNIHLDACSLDKNAPAPHIFYKKQGLISHSKFMNWKLDNYIKNKRITPAEKFEITEMYFPKDKPSNIFSKTANLIKYLLKYKHST